MKLESITLPWPGFHSQKFQSNGGECRGGGGERVFDQIYIYSLNLCGCLIAQVGVKKEVEKVMAGRDLYQVVVKPGIDQAFVFGVIAILDYIYDGSTRC